MNTPPIPSFEPYSCPNCGLPLSEIVEFCPACGARTENAQRRPRWLSCLMMTVLVIFMVPLGLLGACFLLMASGGGVNQLFGGSSSSGSWDGIVTGAIGLVLFGAAVLCGIGFNKLNKK